MVPSFSAIIGYDYTKRKWQNRDTYPVFSNPLFRVVLYAIHASFSNLGKISPSVKSYLEIGVNYQITICFHQITTETKTMFQTKTAIAPELFF